KRQLNVKSGATVSSGTFSANLSILRLDQASRDGETKPDAAKAVCAVVFLLDERIENFPDHLRFNADAGVGYFNEERSTTFHRVACSHGNGAAGRRKFHGVLEHVPKNLLHAHGVGLDAIVRRGEIKCDLDLPLTRIGAHDLVGIPQGNMCVDWTKVEPHLAGGDTGNIEHVIDELRLQRDTF